MNTCQMTPGSPLSSGFHDAEQNPESSLGGSRSFGLEASPTPISHLPPSATHRLFLLCSHHRVTLLFYLYISWQFVSQRTLISIITT